MCLDVGGCCAWAFQEANRKQRQQFKGLFDKKPGELAGVGAAAKGGHAQAPPKMRRTLNDTDGSAPLAEKPARGSGAPTASPGGSIGPQAEGGLEEFKAPTVAQRKGGSWLAWLPSLVFFVIIAASSMSVLKRMGQQEL